jgi:hypothetical protein
VAVYNRIECFNTLELEELDDLPWSGHPPIYRPDEKTEVIAADLTRSKDRGLGFGCWTLDRLEVYLNVAKGLGFKRSRIDESLIDEAPHWRKQET